MVSKIARGSLIVKDALSRSFVTTSRTMAQSTRASEVISETARAEGWPEKGSTSAQMQSQVGKTRNFEQAAQEVGAKMEETPEAVTFEDAAHVKSREARAMGQSQPPSDSISAQAQRLAAVNERDAKLPDQGQMDPATQSAADRVQNFEDVAQSVAQKMADAPESVTREEADKVHSREQRVFGETSKGGIARQAQSLASENQKS